MFFNEEEAVDDILDISLKLTHYCSKKNILTCFNTGLDFNNNFNLIHGGRVSPPESSSWREASSSSSSSPACEKTTGKDGGRLWSPQLRLCSGGVFGPEISRNIQHYGVDTGTFGLVHWKQKAPRPHSSLLDEVAEEMWVAFLTCRS